METNDWLPGPSDWLKAKYSPAIGYRVQSPYVDWLLESLWTNHDLVSLAPIIYKMIS